MLKPSLWLCLVMACIAAPAQSLPAGSNTETSSTSSPADSKQLEPLKTQKAAYPLKAREDGIQGEVWVKFDVLQTGDVENPTVISGDPILAQAALDAIRQWTFKPF